MRFGRLVSPPWRNFWILADVSLLSDGLFSVRASYDCLGIYPLHGYSYVSYDRVVSNRKGKEDCGSEGSSSVHLFAFPLKLIVREGRS